MSPSKFEDSEVTKGVMINKPLRMNKDSHRIYKPSSSSHEQVIENSNRVSTKRQPVIIYTHSPKVIHAQASDFMALVQKLTGMSRSEEVKTVKSESESTKDEEEKDCGAKKVGSDEKFVSEVKKESNPYAPLLITQNWNETFCSLRPDNSLFQNPNSISPSFMDFMKGFPEY